MQSNHDDKRTKEIIDAVHSYGSAVMNSTKRCGMHRGMNNTEAVRFRQLLKLIGISITKDEAVEMIIG